MQFPCSCIVKATAFSVRLFNLVSHVLACLCNLFCVLSPIFCVLSQLWCVLSQTILRTFTSFHNFFCALSRLFVLSRKYFHALVSLQHFACSFMLSNCLYVLTFFVFQQRRVLPTVAVFSKLLCLPNHSVSSSNIYVLLQCFAFSSNDLRALPEFCVLSKNFACNILRGRVTFYVLA